MVASNDLIGARERQSLTIVSLSAPVSVSDLTDPPFVESRV
jgi:hypothetical protein